MSTLDGEVNSGRSLQELLRELRGQWRRLIGQEIRLARLELRQTLHSAVRDFTFLVVGALLGLVATMTLVAAGSIGLAVLLQRVVAPEIAAWLGPVILGGALAIAAVSVMKTGQKRLRQLSQRDLVPRTRQTMQENKAWIEEHLT